VKNGLWQSNIAAYNNWRGAQGAFYSWDTGGAKFMLDHDSTFNNLTTIFNQAHGAAFDTDNRNASFDSFISVENVGDGFLAEKSEGPLSYSNSFFCRNNTANDPSGGGFGLRDSALVSFTNTTLFGNSGSQFQVDGHLTGYFVRDWETGQLYTVLNENLSLSQDILAGTQSAQVFGDGYLGGTDWSQLVQTLISDNNTWWSGRDTNAFTVPIPKSWTKISLGEWQGLTGQDANSTWTPISSPAACNVASQGEDYWLLVMGSLSPPVTVSSAGVATWNLATASLGGMKGTVNLSAELSALPGASAIFNPASITTAGTSAMKLTIAPGTASGKYAVTIVGNSGSVTRTVTVSVVVP
jgi:hypothetical protein